MYKALEVSSYRVGYIDERDMGVAHEGSRRLFSKERNEDMASNCKA